MIDGNARDFIEKLHYEDHYVIYNGEKIFSMVVRLNYSPMEIQNVSVLKYTILQQTKRYFQLKKLLLLTVFLLLKKHLSGMEKHFGKSKMRCSGLMNNRELKNHCARNF